MKKLLLLIPIILLSNICIAQNSVVISDGILISIDGINVAKYELEVEYFEGDEITIDHLLCVATDECDEELVLSLLERGANVNFNCEEEDAVITNLAFCLDNGVELTKLLLNNGANINGADRDNDSFLSYAISYDNLKLAEYLIDHGVDRLQRDTNLGCLPVHSVKSVAMLELLMSKGFVVNSSCTNGRNILHFAARKNLVELAQYIVDQNLVDIKQKDNNGETPLDYAKRLKHRKIIAIINQ